MDALREILQPNQPTVIDSDIQIISNIKILMLEKMNKIYFIGIGNPNKSTKRSMNVIHHVALFLTPQVRNFEWLDEPDKLEAMKYVQGEILNL